MCFVKCCGRWALAGSIYICVSVQRERASVGLDVHARSGGGLRHRWQYGAGVPSTAGSAAGDGAGLAAELPSPVGVVYEAGPTGYGLARFLTDHNIRCVVAAPSKLQRPSGDRVKTDAKDAQHLARLLRLDEITPVVVPTVAQEAARDLVRAREDVRGDLMRARHRTSKLLQRQGIVWSGGTAWTGAHHDWLRRQTFSQPALMVAYDSALETVLLSADRRDQLDKAIVEMAADPAWSAIVTRLGCLRGVSTLTAFGLAVEVGRDLHRRDLVRHGLVRLRLAPSRPRRLARRGATVLPPSSGWTAIGPNCASLVSRSTTGEPHPMERDDLEHEAIADNAWNCGRYLSRWVPRLPQPTAQGGLAGAVGAPRLSAASPAQPTQSPPR